VARRYGKRRWVPYVAYGMAVPPSGSEQQIKYAEPDCPFFGPDRERKGRLRCNNWNGQEANHVERA
jgi:hypothetical protein